MLKLFEQIWVDLKLTISQSELPKAEQKFLIGNIRKEFYCGLIEDLIEYQGFDVAQIVYTELLNSHLKLNSVDRIIGLKISALQLKMDEFEPLFLDILTMGDLTPGGAESMGELLLKFEIDADKQKAVNLAINLQEAMREGETNMLPTLFDSLARVYCENQ